MKSCQPKTAWTTALALLLLGATLCACSRHAMTGLPVLSDPDAGLTVTLPASATSFTHQPAAKDRFVSQLPYNGKQTLLYLHAYSPPLVMAGALPVSHKDMVSCILRDELGSFLELDTSFTNLPDQTPVLLLYGRTRDPDKIIGFALQCNKTRFIFIGLSGPDFVPADVATFFQTTVTNLHIAAIDQTTFADAAQYQSHQIDASDPVQSLNFIRNVFASRNTNPVNYILAISHAYLLAQQLQLVDSASPHLSEVLAILNNMAAIRLADYLKARHDFEIAYGQRDTSEALAQARFLVQLSYPFDAEARALGKQRIRKTQALP